MKAVLHETTLDCYEKVFEQRKLIELNGETVVPDKMPDIGLLGDVNTHVILRVKRTESGLGILEGELQSAVCFLPDGENGCHSLEQTLMWSAEFESDDITEDSTAIGEVRLVQIESRMLNPRKILVKAQLSVVFTAYNKQKAVICSSAEEQSAVQVRTTALDCSVIGTVCEKTFVATDAEGTPLYPAMLYTDPRGWEERDELSEKIGRREILHITGVDPHEMYSISKMMWLKKHCFEAR